MIKEIGSEFWIENKATVKTDLKRFSWLSKFGQLTYLASGRGAISILLKCLEPIKKNVLMPAYICDSVILPFSKNAYECYFYDVNIDLTPNIDKLPKLKDIGIFIHLGYFGFHTNSNLDQVLQYLKKQGTFVVEDVTHSLFSDYKRYYENDFYIGSLRKWFGIPSGGFLSSRTSIINEPIPENEVLIKLREEALLLKGKYFETNDEKLKEIFLNKFSDAEKILDNDANPYQIDDLSLQLLDICDDRELTIKRRENYRYLIEELEKIDLIKVLFPVLEDDICPMFFPILIKGKRDQVRKELIEEKIYCPIHWPIPEQIDADKYHISFELYNSELSIPCDQRYGIEDMKRIVSVIRRLDK